MDIREFKKMADEFFDSTEIVAFNPRNGNVYPVEMVTDIVAEHDDKLVLKLGPVITEED